MQEQLISIETAKLAKEKGFNISTKSYYGCDNPSGDEVKPNQLFTIELKEEGITESQKGTMIYSAPRQSLLQKWLKKQHSLYIKPYPVYRNEKLQWEYVIFFLDEPLLSGIDDFKNRMSLLVDYPYYWGTEEEALERGLQEALKLI